MFFFSFLTLSKVQNSYLLLKIKRSFTVNLKKSLILCLTKGRFVRQIKKYINFSNKNFLKDNEKAIIFRFKFF